MSKSIIPCKLFKVLSTELQTFIRQQFMGFHVWQKQIQCVLGYVLVSDSLYYWMILYSSRLMWVITPIKMWSLPKSINKSALDSSNISLSSYFIFKTPFLFYKLLFSTLIHYTQHIEQNGLSFPFPLRGKWEITLPCPKILVLDDMNEKLESCTMLWNRFSNIFSFAEVNFSVLGKMSSLGKTSDLGRGLWCRYPQPRPTQANSKPKAAKETECFCSKWVILGSGLH